MNRLSPLNIFLCSVPRIKALSRELKRVTVHACKGVILIAPPPSFFMVIMCYSCYYCSSVCCIPTSAPHLYVIPVWLLHVKGWSFGKKANLQEEDFGVTVGPHRSWPWRWGQCDGAEHCIVVFLHREGTLRSFIERINKEVGMSAGLTTCRAWMTFWMSGACVQPP